MRTIVRGITMTHLDYYYFEIVANTLKARIHNIDIALLDTGASAWG